MMTSEHTSLTALLLAARQTRRPLPSVGEALVPRDLDQAYRIQDEVAAALAPDLGPIAGWKVGAPGVDAEPNCAPIHQATIFMTGATIPAARFFHRGVESEVVYRLAHALPPRLEPYTEADLRAAIASAHPALEIFDSRFVRPNSQDPLVHLADQANHGAMVVGPALEQWQSLVPLALPVRQEINGRVLCEHTGGNSAGDPIRLLVWLANHAAARGCGLVAEAFILSGSTTSTTYVEVPASINTRFDGLGAVSAVLA